jgi:hypothetical protein
LRLFFPNVHTHCWIIFSKQSQIKKIRPKGRTSLLKILCRLMLIFFSNRYLRNTFKMRAKILSFFYFDPLFLESFGLKFDYYADLSLQPSYWNSLRRLKCIRTNKDNPLLALCWFLRGQINNSTFQQTLFIVTNKVYKKVINSRRHLVDYTVTGAPHLSVLNWPCCTEVIN